jgi:hypothetical protein
VEWALNTHWSAKAQYLYADFGALNATGSYNAPACRFHSKRRGPPDD